MHLSRALCLNLVLLSSCKEISFVAPNPGPVVQQDGDFASELTPKLDLLFVIDNSGSMASEQRRLRSDFKHMMEAFEKRAGIADLHVAVVSTDVGAANVDCGESGKRPGGDLGQFKVGNGCGLMSGAKFLSSQPGVAKNFEGSLTDVFSCMSDLGTKGCGYEHTLLSMRLALDDKNTPENAGFLRRDADLGIVIITDEDDCSAPPRSTLFSDSSFVNQAPSLRCALKGHVCNNQRISAQNQEQSLAACEASADGGGELYPVDDFVNFVKGLKSGTSAKLLVSALAGWTREAETGKYALGPNKDGQLDLVPVCQNKDPLSTEPDTAFPALRIKRFIDAFDKSGTLQSICQEDFRPAMEKIGDAWAKLVAPRCVPGKLIDVDQETQGLQPNCVVSEIANAANGAATVVSVLPACAKDAAKPCWKFVAEDQGKSLCGDDSGAIEVERTHPPSEGAKLQVRCEARAN
jgi:hypothetical protein